MAARQGAVPLRAFWIVVKPPLNAKEGGAASFIRGTLEEVDIVSEEHVCRGGLQEERDGVVPVLPAHREQARHYSPSSQGKKSSIAVEQVP